MGPLSVLVLANPDGKKKKANKQAKKEKPMTKKKRSAKQEAATRKLVAMNKARAKSKNPSNPAPKKKGKGKSKGKGRKKSPNPSNPGRQGAAAPRGNKRRKRRNGEDSTTRGISAAQVLAGLVIGGATAAAAEYVMAGTEALATPGRRAMVQGGAGTLVAIPAVVWPKARGFFAGAAGPFIGLAGKNIVQIIFSGTPKQLPSGTTAQPGSGQTATNGQPAQPGTMSGLRIVPPHALPAHMPGMQGVVMDRQSLRGLVIPASMRRH